MMEFGPLAELMQNKDIANIRVNAPDSIFVWDMWKGRAEAAIQFESEAELRRIAEEMLQAGGVSINEDHPIADALLPDGSHVRVIIPPLSARGTVMTIEKTFDEMSSLEIPVEIRAISQAAADFLVACSKVRANIVVTGDVLGQTPGKSTILNILVNLFQQSRVVVIQPNNYLRVPSKNVVFLKTRQPDFSTRKLVDLAMQLDPDRLVVGHVEGDEFGALLNAMGAGYNVMFAMNASSPRDALARMETMATSANLSSPLLGIRQQIASSLNVIVHMALMDDELKRVVSITEVQGMQGDAVALETIFHRSNPNDLYEMTATGTIPKIYDRMKTWGAEPSEDVFKP